MPGKRPVGNAITIDIHPASKPFFLYPSFGQYFTPADFLRIVKRVSQPRIHAQIQIAHDEHRRLQLFGQVEGCGPKFKAFGNRGRQEQNVG